jgi:8-oxo-dGTP diphosphatase
VGHVLALTATPHRTADRGEPVGLRDAVLVPNELPLREAVRALVIDRTDRVLLVQFSANSHEWWAMPGGGIEEGEPELIALRRELEEEVGLGNAELVGPVWHRVHPWPEHPCFSGQAEPIYFLRCAAFDPSPRLSWEQLNGEGVVGLRWWSFDELRDAEGTPTPPRAASRRSWRRCWPTGRPPPSSMSASERRCPLVHEV